MPAYAKKRRFFIKQTARFMAMLLMDATIQQSRGPLTPPRNTASAAGLYRS